ncbi:9955_t:CDS:1, partial [Entrophospora sp. SA101]
KHVKRLADNYECRSYCATPPPQIKYIRDLPDSPQLKSLIR